MAKYRTGTGIYIGENVVDIVEIQDEPGARRISSFARERIVGKEEKPKMGVIAPSEDDTAAAAVKRCIESSGIITEYTNTSILEKDLTIRFFKMPRVPKKKRDQAVRFEARKYIPFRIEETASSFLVTEEKGAQMSILFAGAKKEKINRQVSIIEKAGLKTALIGTVPEALSLVLKNNDQLEKNSATLVAHIGEGKTAGIYVIKDEIPYLTRDIYLGTDPSELGSKLAGEIQLSVDYFRRQFSGIDISKIVIAGETKDTQLFEYITSQLGIACEPLDITRKLKSEVEIPPGSCIAVGLALMGLEKRKKPYMNLLPLALRPKEKELLKPAVITGICACLILVGAYIFFGRDANKIKAELNQVLQFSPKVEASVKQLAVTPLKNYQDSLVKKAVFLGSVTNGRVILAEKLDQISAILPEEAWITSLTYEEEMTPPREEKEYPKVAASKLKIEGFIAGSSRSQESEKINNLVADIKNNDILFKGFSDASIKSTKVVKFPNAEATKFDIELTGK